MSTFDNLHRTCHLMDSKNRCPKDPDAPVALSQPGDLNAIFERITQDPNVTSRYGLHILSQPHKTSKINNPSVESSITENDESRIEKEEMTNTETITTTTTEEEEKDNNNNDDDAPWVITLDGFLSDEECDRVIEIASQEGYLNSIDFIADRASGARTSQLVWCDHGCSKDPVMQTLDARISELLGIPSENFEFFQILKYDVGQFYKEHNDYNIRHKEIQPGVRVLTVFLYLNDVEEGGGTNFPTLGNITVTPTRGRALIWPSVLNQDPHSEDVRLTHEALPVEKGIKHAANVWVHQREYREAHHWGCCNP
jgi:prolyl 4-hydroxylase